MTTICYHWVVVLSGLWLLDVGLGRNWERDWGFVGDERADQVFVVQGQGLLLLNPVGPCKRFQDFSRLACASKDVLDVSAQLQDGVEGYPLY